MGAKAALAINPDGTLKKKPISYSNLLLGAGLTLFEINTLGQPFEVLKTQMAANREQTLAQAFKYVWRKGGVLGFYQGLIPWAWIEASTKGSVLLFTASELEYRGRMHGLGPFASGLLGGFGGGLAQAYTTMGLCTTMKTAEITRQKAVAKGQSSPGTIALFRNILRTEGIRGVNKGINAVALRQCTNWGSRMALARLAEQGLCKVSSKSNDKKLTGLERIVSSTIAGGLSCWNQPFEVVRVEMQSMIKDPKKPAKLSVIGTGKYIYKQNGIKGLYRGVTPRICLGAWQTICMVSLADIAREKMLSFNSSSRV